MYNTSMYMSQNGIPITFPNLLFCTVSENTQNFLCDKMDTIENMRWSTNTFDNTFHCAFVGSLLKS